MTDIPCPEEVNRQKTEEHQNEAERKRKEEETTGDPEALYGETETKREENTLNIVLVGGSGYGKTTMINGIANIFKYRNFEDAMKTGPRVCIPTRFSTFVGKNGVSS